VKFVGNMRASMTCPAEDWKVCVMLGDLMVDPARGFAASSRRQTRICESSSR